MSDLVHHGARPEGAWSGPAFFDDARRLHEHYARFCRGVSRPWLTAVAKSHGRHLHDSDAPLSDRYMPCVTIELKTVTGKIAVVFPKFGGYVGNDGSNIERAVTIHYAGRVVGRDVAEIVDFYISGLPPSDVELGTVRSLRESERSSGRGVRS